MIKLCMKQLVVIYMYIVIKIKLYMYIVIKIKVQRVKGQLRPNGGQAMAWLAWPVATALQYTQVENMSPICVQVFSVW